MQYFFFFYALLCTSIIILDRFLERQPSVKFGTRLTLPDFAPLSIFRYQHVDPHEAIQIHRDLKAKVSIAIHCCTFSLTLEPMDEPPRILQEQMVGPQCSCCQDLLSSFDRLPYLIVVEGQGKQLVCLHYTEAWRNSANQGRKAHEHSWGSSRGSRVFMKMSVLRMDDQGPAWVPDPVKE